MSIRTICLYLKISYLWIASLQIKEIEVSWKRKENVLKSVGIMNRSNGERLVHPRAVCRTKMWLILRMKMLWRVERGKHFDKGQYPWEGGNGDLWRKKERMLTKSSKQTLRGAALHSDSLLMKEFIYHNVWCEAPGQRGSCLFLSCGYCKFMLMEKNQGSKTSKGHPLWYVPSQN